MSRTLDDVINNFVKGKGQGLIILLEYKIRHLIFFYKLTYTFSGSPEVGKILTVKGLFKYLERSLYTVCSTLLYSSNHCDFLDICWEAWLEYKDV